MRVNFCVLTNPDGNEIYINPLLVRYFHSQGPHGDKDRLTRIVFDNGDTILVNGSPANVGRGLNAESQDTSKGTDKLENCQPDAVYHDVRSHY
jgi:hypothetical protein